MTDWYVVENVDAIPSPALLIYPDRVRANLQRMIANAGGADRVRPHVKTHKMPDVIRLKRELGIHKFKAATIAEAEMTASAGGEDVLLAYQPVGPHIDRLLKLVHRFPETRFTTMVDDAAILKRIEAACREHDRRLELYVDLNVGMNRTGVEPADAAFELYRQIVQSPVLEPAGLHAYEGHLHDTSLDELRTSVDQVFAPVWKLRERLQSAGMTVPKVVASGTPTAKILAEYEGVEVGAGTTVLWDFGQESLSPDLGYVNAAVLLARVISRPTRELICVDLGHKAVASEMPHPRVRFFGLEDAVPVTHSEEHLVLRIPNSDEIPPGTPLYGIPQHICPSVALHQEAWCVRDGRYEGTWPVTARNRRLNV